MINGSAIFNYEVLSSLSSQIAVIDRSGTIIGVNKTWDDFASQSGVVDLSDTSTGSNYFTVCNKALALGELFAGKALAGIESVFQKTQKVFELEYPCFSIGDHRWFLLQAVLLNNDSSKVVIAHHDITQRKKTEDALAASELKYRRLFETAKDGILILDAETGKITDVNPFMIHKLGYTYNEFIGKALWQIGLFSDVEASKMAFLALQKNKYIRYENLPLKNKNGETLNVEFVSNVYDVNKEKVIQCNIRDITDQKKAAIESLELLKQVQLKNKDLKQFAYIVSHNLRSHIVKIQGLIFLINEDTEHQSEIPFLLQTMSNEIIRLDDVIRDLNQILYLHDSEGKSLELVSFAGILDKLKLVLSDQIDEAKAVIISDFSEAETISSIHSYCYSILYNLLSNAIKYRMPERRVMIHIKTTVDQGFVCLSVKDNGMGIDTVKHAGKIFALYKRFHGDNIQGKGIGLNLVKVQAESLGGRAEVESIVNEGTEFKIFLPIILRL